MAPKITCRFCGFEVRDGDEHVIIGEMQPDRQVPVTCKVTVLCQNPRPLGIVTGTT